MFPEKDSNSDLQNTKKGCLPLESCIVPKFFSYCQGFLEVSPYQVEWNPTQGHRIKKDLSDNKPLLIIFLRKERLEMLGCMLKLDMVRKSKCYPSAKLNTTPWRHVVEWKHSSTHSYLTRWRKVSATTSGRFTLGRRILGTHWIGSCMGRGRWTFKAFPLPGIDSRSLGYSACSLDTVLTELSWLTNVIVIPDLDF
jgi:hypothetical protein